MKKILSIMLLTLFVSLFAGCSRITYESFARNYLDSIPNRTNNTGITIEIYPQIIFINDMPAELTIRATNNTSYYLHFAYVYRIERFVGEG